MDNIAPWIQTFTGRKAEIFDLKPEQICIEDIAHALAMICRFGGHCRRFYSVAEHSVRMSWKVWDEVKGSAEERRIHSLDALLHDAAEAYLGDVVAPLKKWTCVVPPYRFATGIDFSALEKAALSTILKTLVGVRPLTDQSALIKEADLRMLATEKRDLLGPEPFPWVDLPEPYDDRITETWSPAVAEVKFLMRWRVLSGQG